MCRRFASLSDESRTVSPREFKARMEDMGARYEETMHERIYRGVRFDVATECVNKSQA